MRQIIPATRSTLRFLVVAAACCLIGAAEAQAQSPAALDQYVVTNADPSVLGEAGFDRHETGVPGKPGQFIVVATADQAAELRGKGATVRPLHGLTRSQPPARTLRRRARAKIGPLPAPTHGFTVGDPPEGSGRAFRNWQASRSNGFEDGPGVRTANSLYLGFGLEGVTGADTARG